LVAQVSTIRYCRYLLLTLLIACGASIGPRDEEVFRYEDFFEIDVPPGYTAVTPPNLPEDEGAWLPVRLYINPDQSADNDALMTIIEANLDGQTLLEAALQWRDERLEYFEVSSFVSGQLASGDPMVTATGKGYDDGPGRNVEIEVTVVSGHTAQEHAWVLLCTGTSSPQKTIQSDCERLRNGFRLLTPHTPGP
jgi:hypothetical protein